MKLNFTIELENDNDKFYSLSDEIVEKAAEMFIDEVLGDFGKEEDMYEKLENSIVKKLENLLDTDFKDTVAKKVTANLANRFEKTKQYNSLLSGEEILSDSAMKVGLRKLIADVVRVEIKKMFK